MDERSKLIAADAVILASIATAEEIEAADQPFSDAEVELWERFCAAGGSNAHSGYSWQLVQSEALKLLRAQS